MTGPSVAQRPPTLDRERVERSAPTTEVRRRSSFVPAIFLSWKEALRYLSVWVGAGLLLYTVLLVAWLIVTKI